MKRTLFSIALAMMILVPSICDARFEYYDRFSTKYPRFTFISCELCHATQTPVAGSGPRNSYGSAWELQPHATVQQQNVAFDQLEKGDADKDGFTNLTEIVANTFAIHVLPGYARLNATFPAAFGYRAVPPKLLFFDNFKNATRLSVPNWTMTPSGGFKGNRVKLVSSAEVTAFAKPTPPGAAAWALNNFKRGTISVGIQLLAGAKPDASIIFSQSPLGFRFVSVSPTEIEIGQNGTVGGISTVAKKKIPFPGFGDSVRHKLKVSLSRTGLVRVFVDRVFVGSKRFPGGTVAGNVGFRSKLTLAKFYNARFSK